MIPKLFDYIGFFGPIILSFITVLKLYKQQPYLIGYFIFLGGNVIVNHVLKHIILEERPSGGRSLINEPYNGMHKYGMPSSHAQSAFYSMTYLYLTKQDPTMLLVELFICALTVYQRWTYRQHTAEQLGIGAIIGIIMGFLAEYMTKQYVFSRTVKP
jgi:membrane-associated phospholipid phosphatase